MNALRRMGAAPMGVTTLLVAINVTVRVDMLLMQTSTLAMVCSSIYILLHLIFNSVYSYFALKCEQILMNVKKILPNVLSMPAVITLLEDITVHVTLDIRVMALEETAAVS